MPIRLDLYRLRRAARQALSRDRRSPEERRLDELRQLAPISSLTEIGRAAVRWLCWSCATSNPQSRISCWSCGNDRGYRGAVRS